MSRTRDAQLIGRPALRLLLVVALLATIAVLRPVLASSDFYLLYRHWQP